MLPNSSLLTSFYAKFVGNHALLSAAQSNLLSHFERILRVRTHTFLSNNAQNEHGISRNYGADRYYSWTDTVINCRNAPELITSDLTRDIEDILQDNRRFQKIKNDLESRMGGFVKVEPFLSILHGKDNMRYNIKHSSKIEDFDMIRIGIHLHAVDEGQFKMGMTCLKDHENPFKMKRHIMECAQPFNA